MSEEKHDKKLDAVYEYTQRASSGFLGRLTSTPAAAAITVLFMMLLFIVILMAFATGNEELIMQLLSSIPGN